MNNPTASGTPLRNLIPSSAIYRVYPILTAVVAGEVVKVLGNQIGQYTSRANAESAARATGRDCKVRFVGGCE